MRESLTVKFKRWWFNLRERFLWRIVKNCVQRIDKMNCGAFMAFSWGVDEITDYHVIAERSLENCHVYGTRVEYYGEQEVER